MNRKLIRRKGFTLIEVAIAIAIVAVLAVTILVGGRYLIASSKVAKVVEATATLQRSASLGQVAEAITAKAALDTTCSSATNMGIPNWAKYWPGSTCPVIDANAGFQIVGAAMAVVPGTNTGGILAVKIQTDTTANSQEVVKGLSGLSTLTAANGFTCATAATTLTNPTVCFQL